MLCFSGAETVVNKGGFSSHCLTSGPTSSLYFLTLAVPVHDSPMPVSAQSFWCISVNLNGLYCLDIKKLAVVPSSICWISNSSNFSPIQ